MDEKNREFFRAEAYELLDELEAALLELETSPENNDLVGSVFRALHTIKGSGAMFGFDTLAAFTHRVETVFDRVRNAEISVTKKLIDTTLLSVDYIRKMLDASITDDIGKGHEWAEILTVLEGLSSVKDKGADTAQPIPENRYVAADREHGAHAIYRIRFKPAADIMKKGINPLLILNELCELGRAEIVAITDDIPAINDIDPELCYTSWDIILISTMGINAIRDVFIFVENDAQILIDTVAEDIGILNETQYKRIGEILIDRKDLSLDAIQNTLEGKKLLGEMLVEKGLVSTQKIRSALVEQNIVRDEIQRYQKNEAASSIRVSAGKLDKLVDLVGELVTVQVRLSQTAVNTKNPELVPIAEEIERLTSDLRDSAIGIRMLPIGTTFNKFKRFLRDLSNELGKDIHLTTEGADTELDKTMLERLNDPLMHLIRNCIDHGIEMPDERLSAGKPKTGEVHLSAIHSGSYILIQISDDGRGLDPESICAKARETGIFTDDVKLSEREIFSLIMAPGFSTATAVTSVSGRGVGLDVVKKSRETLKGSIDIDSKKGTGTTITLVLPLTLAIIEGLLVKVSGETFILPLSYVEECVEFPRGHVETSYGRQVALIRGQIIPYIRLRERFSLNGDLPPIEYIVITENEGSVVGLVVDHIIGEHQTVLKSLSRFYKHLKEISGATILGDGKVALVIDVPKLIQGYEKEVHHAQQKNKTD
jgi:two-component system chemotaxis sensor kinase CheA